MNQPTREEFDELKERLARVEQATEPIELKIVRGLPLPEATLLQKIMDQVGRHGPDIASVQTAVSKLLGHAHVADGRLDKIERTLEEILRRLPEKGESGAS